MTLFNHQMTMIRKKEAIVVSKENIDEVANSFIEGVVMKLLQCLEASGTMPEQVDADKIISHLKQVADETEFNPLVFQALQTKAEIQAYKIRDTKETLH